MTASSTMIRIFRGILFLIKEIIRLEKETTIVMEIPMTKAVVILTVTARAEHIPNIWIDMGFSPQIGSVKVLNDFVFVIFIFCTRVYSDLFCKIEVFF